MKTITDVLDGLYELQDCDTCPYRCRKCDDSGCVVDELKDYLRELIALREETEEQELVIKELIQESEEKECEK